MSHPLRAPMVRAMGEKAFQGVYSLISLILFGLMIYFYRVIGREPPLWDVIFTDQPELTHEALLGWLSRHRDLR